MVGENDRIPATVLTGFLGAGKVPCFFFFFVFFIHFFLILHSIHRSFIDHFVELHSKTKSW